MVLLGILYSASTEIVFEKLDSRDFSVWAFYWGIRDYSVWAIEAFGTLVFAYPFWGSVV